MADIKPKKARSYVLDFWKFIGCVLVALHHWMNVSMPNGYAEGFSDYFGRVVLTGEIDIKYPLGAYTLGFFTFTTGYWLVNAFKGLQAKGAFGKGNDMELIYRYTAKNYVAYMPLAFITSFAGYFVSNFFSKSSLKVWIDSFVSSIWYFFGFSGFGINDNLPINNDTNVNGLFTWMFGGTIEEHTAYMWSPVTWYICALICYACVFYVLLVVNEKLTVFGILPLFLGMSFYANQGYVAIQYGTEEPHGLYTLLSSDFTRLWGPAVAGIWGWYLINALKKANISNKTKNFMGWANLILTVSAFVQVWTGYFGGMINFDMHLILIVILTLVNKDWFTIGFNKILSKIPGIGVLSEVGLGIFLFHPTLFAVGVKFWIPAYGLGKATLLYIGSSLLAGVLYVPFNKFVVKPTQGKLSKLLGLATPVGEMFGKKEESPAEAK